MTGKKLREQIYLGLILLVSAGIIYFLIVLNNLRKANADNRELDKIYALLKTTENLFSDAQDFETGTRGYLLTGDALFLEPYYESIERIPRDELQFTQAIAGSGFEQDGYLFIRTFRLCRELQINLVESRTHNQLNPELVLKKLTETKLLMDKIRLSKERMEQSMRKILLEKNEANKTGAKNIFLFFEVNGMLLLLLCIWIFFINRKGLMYEKSIELINEELGIELQSKSRKVKEALDKFKTEENKYRYLFDHNPQPMWVIDSETRQFLDVNLAAEVQYGYSREEFLSMSADQIRPPEEVSKFNTYLEIVKEKLLGENNIWKHVRKNGEVIDVEVRGHHIIYNGKTARLILALDVTNRLKTENEIREKSRQLEVLNANLERIREEERITIARDIHDELGQLLTAVKIDFAWLKKRHEFLPYKDKTDEITRLLDMSTQSIRRIASNLRPGILDDLGLIAALEWLCNEFTKTHFIPCHFASVKELDNLTPDIAIVLFRIVQESLTNIARHASASEVNIRVEHKDQTIRLVINDNGVGFEPALKKTGLHFGIAGMKERARQVNGELTIESEPGKGTVVTLIIQIHGN